MSKELIRKLYDMEIHETMELKKDGSSYPHTVITRVPNGWLYERQEPQINALHQVFVPDNNMIADALAENIEYLWKILKNLN